MTGPSGLLAADTVRTLFARRTTALLLVLIFALLTVVSCSLQVTGETVVNGAPVPFGDEARQRLAVTTAFGGAHALGVLLIVLLLLPSLAGEIDGRLAIWIVTKPIARSVYLRGRLLGGVAFLAAVTGFVVLGLEVLLAKYAGALAPRVALGWGILLALLIGYLVWGMLFSLHLGAGIGGIALLVLAASGAIVDTDALTALLLRSTGDEPSGGILGVLLRSFLGGGEPPLAVRIAYGVLYALLPGTGNVHDIAVAYALGVEVPFASDLFSLVVLAVGLPIGILLASRSLARRDL
jgi:hypothetical protein